MILSVDPSRALPVYEQVREQIRRMVAAGTLQPGTRLPTIRQLAADLGLAKGTIERAYELLEGDAVIERHGRNGTYVAENAAVSARDLAVGLEAAAEQLVIVARQLGADEAAAVDALRKVWRRL
jgi:DNA-binding transcriptional regulator YhcF (GntR family)